jgi:20S proteasome subunit alpha 6
MTLEYARKAAAAGAKDGEGGGGEEAAVKEVEERVGEVIRCLPGHLVYKSLDGMFKEWRVEKKGGRG